jgi:hypothetical protein
MMQRKQDKRLIILVESSEDSGVIDPHLNDSEIDSFPGYGKESVLEAAQMFLDYEVGEVVAVVDADFDRYTGRQHQSNVVMTEFYDLDADVMVHCRQASDAIVANFTDKDKRQSYLASHNVSVDDAIWNMAIMIGEIRYCSVVRQCGLNLREFPLHAVLKDYERGEAQAAALKIAVGRSSNAIALKASEITAEIIKLPDNRHIVSGHDLISALAAFIQNRWGGRAGNKVLASALRSAVQCQCWKRTVVYGCVWDWARQFAVNAWTCP